MTAANVRLLRVQLCRRRGLTVPQANALSLLEAADAYDAATAIPTPGGNDMRGDVPAITALVAFVQRHNQRSLSSEEIAELRRLDAEASAVIQRHGEPVYALETGGPGYGHFGGTKIPVYAMNPNLPLHPTEDWYRMMGDIAARISNRQGDPPRVGPGEGDRPEPDPVLSERQLDTLRALYDLEAFDADSRQPTEAIATKAQGNLADAAGFKEPIAELARLGLIKTKTGRGGGCWLTPEGRAREEQRRKR